MRTYLNIILITRSVLSILFIMDSDIKTLFKCLVCEEKLKETHQKMHLPSFRFKCNRCDSFLNSRKRAIKKRRSKDVIKKVLSEQKFKIGQIDKILTKIAAEIEKGSKYIAEHCAELIRKVSLATEQTIKQINEQSNQLINQIESYEKECQLIFKNIHESGLQFTEKEIDSNSMEINKNVMEYIIRLETNLDMIENTILNTESIEFEPNDCDLEEDFLGAIYYDDSIVDKSISCLRITFFKLTSFKCNNFLL